MRHWEEQHGAEFRRLQTRERVRRCRHNNSQRAVVPRARNVKKMHALDADEFAMAKQHNVGTLGGCPDCNVRGCTCRRRYMCTHCGALLFPAEAKAAKVCGPFQTKWNGGKLCCSGGKVQLQPIMRDTQIEALWENPKKRKLLHAHARQFNNALALASTQAKAGAVPGRHGWNPSVVIQGKLHHYTGPLHNGTADRRYAQLYVNDPAANDDCIVNLRYARMLMPKNTSQPKMHACKELLMERMTVLQGCNRYVRDIVTAGELFAQLAASEQMVQGSLIIDARKAPASMDKRTYSHNGQRRVFNEVTMLVDEVPAHRDIVLRYRDGGVHKTDETHRAYDPLHFVMLHACGDDGWRPYMKLVVPSRVESRTEEGSDDELQLPEGWEALREAAPRGQISPRAYYAYRLHIRVLRRDELGNEWHDDVLIRAGRLFQEYCCSALYKAEAQRLLWHRLNQKTLRADQYQNVKDAVATPSPPPLLPAGMATCKPGSESSLPQASPAAHAIKRSASKTASLSYGRYVHRRCSSQ